MAGRFRCRTPRARRRSRLDRRGGDHHRAHQDGAPGRAALAALEVAVRRRRAELVADELVGVHREAHRAARLAPFEAGVAEDAVEPFRSRGASTICEPGTASAFTPRRDLPALEVFRDLAEVRQAAVGAAADERDVDLRALDRRAGRELHVFERLRDRGSVSAVRSPSTRRDTLCRSRSPGRG